MAILIANKGLTTAEGTLQHFIYEREYEDYGISNEGLLELQNILFDISDALSRFKWVIIEDEGFEDWYPTYPLYAPAT